MWADLLKVTPPPPPPRPPSLSPDLVTAHDWEDRQPGVGEGSSNQAASSGALQLRLLEGLR